MPLHHLTSNHHASRKEMTESNFLLRKQLRLKQYSVNLGGSCMLAFPELVKPRERVNHAVVIPQHMQHVCLMPLSGYLKVSALSGCRVASGILKQCNSCKIWICLSRPPQHKNKLFIFYAMPDYAYCAILCLGSNIKKELSRAFVEIKTNVMLEEQIYIFIIIIIVFVNWNKAKIILKILTLCISSNKKII